MTDTHHTERELLIRSKLAAQSPGDDFLRFTRALLERDGSTLDVAYFLEKPWKWATDYIAWSDAGEPDSPTADGWEAFEAVA